MADWNKTDKPGIYEHSEINGKYKVDTTATNPEGDRKRRRQTLNNVTMAEAIAVRERLKAEIENPPEGGETTRQKLASFAGRWAREKIDSGDWGSKRTIATSLQILEDHVMPVIGDRPLDDLCRSDVRRWTEYAEGLRRTVKNDDGEPVEVPYSHASLRRYWQIVTQLLRALFAEGYFDDRFRTWLENYRGPRSPRSGVREDRTLTRDQLDTFLDKTKALRPDWYPAILALASTGMRAGELFGLEWKHIRFDDGFILVEQAFRPPRDDYEGGLKVTKTATTRTPPLTRELAAVLRKHRQRLKRDENPGLFEGIVFPAPAGNRRRASDLHDPMRKISEACDFDIRVGPQVLRKTFITLLGNAGVRREMIKAITGHSTDEMHDHYTVVQPVDQLEVVEDFFGS